MVAFQCRRAEAYLGRVSCPRWCCGKWLGKTETELSPHRIWTQTQSWAGTRCREPSHGPWLTPLQSVFIHLGISTVFSSGKGDCGSTEYWHTVSLLCGQFDRVSFHLQVTASTTSQGNTIKQQSKIQHIANSITKQHSGIKIKIQIKYLQQSIKVYCGARFVVWIFYLKYWLHLG